MGGAEAARAWNEAEAQEAVVPDPPAAVEARAGLLISPEWACEGGMLMSNLGAYVKMTTLAKKFGGPWGLLIVVAGGGYAVLRSAEAVGKTAFTTAKAAVKRRSMPCATKGELFEVVADGKDRSGLKLRAGDEYRVLDCDSDAILIEVLDDPNNPYFVSSEFLSTISDFPAEDAADGD